MSMSTPEFTTLQQALEWAEQQFTAADLCFGQGTDSAWDEAVWLALHTLHLPYDSPKEVGAIVLDETQQAMLLTIFRRRISERIPAAYLTQQAFFAGHEFYVDQRVIIPRSPIAELINQHFEPWINPDKVTRILDLCCGSGCIAIACAYAFPNAQVDAVDISADALAVAEINVAQHHMQQQVTLIQSDLLQALAGKKYDIIVTNPPYVDAHDMATCPEEFHWEPELALAAGTDGLQCADQILAQAKAHLTEHGILILEVGNSAPALEAKYPRLPFTWLHFEHGGEGVALLTAQELVDL